MSILFYSIQKTNSITGITRYYASHRKEGTCELFNIAEQISEGTSFTSADVYGVLESFTKIIPLMLMDGKHVRLGDLGTFSLKINSHPERSARAVDVRSIKGTTMNFLPGSRVKRMLHSTKFKKDEKRKQGRYAR